MKFIIDEIIYYDEEDPKIEISWSTVDADGTKKPFLNEIFRWQNYPEILAPIMLKKMKPLRDEEEPGDEDNLFMGHYSRAKRLQNLVSAQLKTTTAQIHTHLNFFAKVPTVTWKKTSALELITPDELRVLYPLSYVIYSEHLLSNGKPCRIPLYMVCHNGIVDAEPAPSLVKEFRPPHSLRRILYPKTPVLVAESSNNESDSSHEISSRSPW
ncbi:MAG: hypothetical protein P4L79_13455 [Legionella sp.]|uniref:hypothetical protein n=1 Tax=Legionella sp. TaxID=459 RepID=UPI00284EC7D5|nr:hypothetical protein [Legionella sp.]